MTDPTPAEALKAGKLPLCPFCRHQTEWQMTDIDGWIAHLYCMGCDMLGPISDFKYDDQEEAKADSLARWQRAFPIPAADAGEVREGLVERVMVLLGELLFKFDPMCGGTDCGYTARMVAPQLVDAILALPQAPIPDLR